MAMIIMAVHDTDENERSGYTFKTLYSLLETVDFNKHSLTISDNASCARTRSYIYQFGISFESRFNFDNYDFIRNNVNLGTAEAINQGIKHRKSQHVIKMDNDVIVHAKGWVDDMEDALKRDPTIGILGLKRRDLEQRPGHSNAFWNSELRMLPQEKGQKWLIVEETPDIMGTCVMLNSALLDKIGYLRQPGVYGYDDVDACVRSRLAGFKNAFLCGIDISHIDTGGDEYSKWKQREAGRVGEEFQKFVRGYKDGSIPLYYSPFK